MARPAPAIRLFRHGRAAELSPPASPRATVGPSGQSRDSARLRCPALVPARDDPDRPEYTIVDPERRSAWLGLDLRAPFLVSVLGQTPSPRCSTMARQFAKLGGSRTQRVPSGYIFKD